MFQTETLGELALGDVIRFELLDPLPSRDWADALTECLPLMEAVIPAIRFSFGVGRSAGATVTAPSIPGSRAVAGIRIGGSSPALNGSGVQAAAFWWPRAVVRQPSILRAGAFAFSLVFSRIFVLAANDNSPHSHRHFVL